MAKPKGQTPIEPDAIPEIAAARAALHAAKKCGRFKARMKMRASQWKKLSAKERADFLCACSNRAHHHLHGLCTTPTNPEDGCVRHGKPGKCRGAAHPRFKTGETSRYTVPPSMRENYERYRRADADTMLAAREEIAVLRALVARSLGAFDLSDGAKWRERLSKLVEAVGVARTAGDEAGLGVALDRLADAVKAGAAQSESERALHDSLEGLRRYLETETKRLKVEGLAPEETMAFALRVLDLAEEGMRAVAAGKAVDKAASDMRASFRVMIERAGQQAEVN